MKEAEEPGNKGKADKSEKKASQLSANQKLKSRSNLTVESQASDPKTTGRGAANVLNRRTARVVKSASKCR